MVLLAGEGLLLAVDGAAAAGEEEAAHALAAAGLDQLEAADDVGFGVEQRLVHRDPHVGLRGVVGDDGDAEALEDLLDAVLAQVAHHELGARGHVLAAAGGEVIEDEELRAAETHYDKAIVGLEQIIAQNDGVLTPELTSVLNQNLDLIENAIDESRTAIATEPQSTAAQESLLQALRSKVTLLQNTILLINEVRKGEGENALDLIDEMRKPSDPSNPI